MISSLSPGSQHAQHEQLPLRVWSSNLPSATTLPSHFVGAIFGGGWDGGWEKLHWKRQAGSEAGQAWAQTWTRRWTQPLKHGRPSLNVCAWMIMIIDGSLNPVHSSSHSSYARQTCRLEGNLGLSSVSNEHEPHTPQALRENSSWNSAKSCLPRTLVFELRLTSGGARRGLCAAVPLPGCLSPWKSRRNSEKGWVWFPSLGTPSLLIPMAKACSFFSLWLRRDQQPCSHALGCSDCQIKHRTVLQIWVSDQQYLLA